jgi:simple sugar transport system permease protein
MIMGDFVIDLIAATLRIATPLIFATLGELFCERAGILNLGIEGTMFFGALSGFTAASLSGSLWVGVLTALVGGMLSGWLMSLFSVRLGVNQHVSGLGITLLMTALSLFGFRVIFGENRILPSIEPFKQLSIFPNNPVVVPIFSQYALTYIAIALVPIVWWIVFRTNFGLNLRSVGDNPEATDAA